MTAVVTTSGDRAESHQVPELWGQHYWRTRLRAREVVADKAYGTKQVYRFLRGQGLLPTIRARKPWRQARERRLQAGFRYDKARDIFVCPEGKKLYREKQRSDGSFLYKVHRKACHKCSRHGVLCKAKRPSITRGGDERLFAWVQAHLETSAARKSLRQRMCTIEPIFAEMKGARGLSRATLRGNWKVHLQALLAFAAHNLRQLVKVTRTDKKPAVANHLVSSFGIGRQFRPQYRSGLTFWLLV